MDLWVPLLPTLREHFTLLRIDTRGHGASTATPKDSTLAVLAKDVLAAADEAGLQRFSLAGVSLGGMVGMQIALDAPDRLNRLALVCTSARMDRQAWTERVIAVRGGGMEAVADLALGRFLSDEFRARYPGAWDTIRRGLLTMNPAGYAACAAAIRDMEIADRLHKISCPTLVVTGNLDLSTPWEGHGDHLVSTIPGARHVSLETAHLAPIEAPQALADTLVAFVGEDAVGRNAP